MMAERTRSQESGERPAGGTLADLPPEGLLDLLTRKQLRYMDLIPRDSFEEKLVYLVLEGQGKWGRAGPVFDQLLEAIRRYDTDDIRTVIFGGGTGLSSVLGGDTTLASWSRSPFGGLKRHFPRLTVAVCMTDDGGSSGRLLRDLRTVALGDLRRAILTSVTPHHLVNRYPAPYPEDLESVAASLQEILNHRFGSRPDATLLRNPCALLKPGARRALPKGLSDYLKRLGSHFLRDAALKRVSLEEQCLGNLLLVASIHAQRRRGPGRSGRPVDPHRPPTHVEVVRGIQDFADRIGAGRNTLYPACTTQGELHVLYQHGVVSTGEDKSARRHSSFPVERVWVHFVQPPRVDRKLLEQIEAADLILFAPGSLYTSIIPILQLPEITEAVRRNRRAFKVLGANFWAQRGETDISGRRRGKEYYVPDLLEASHHNIPGGIKGLFEYVIVTDLQSIPGDILRNYALEGKVPIYLDKHRVREMGFEPVEAAVFSEQKLRHEKVIQHDPEKFALAVRTLSYLRRFRNPIPRPFSLAPSSSEPRPTFSRKGYLCEYWSEASRRVRELDVSPAGLREALLDLLWSNREIPLEHLSYMAGVRMIRAREWARSTEWDNIQGYYDPEDGYLKIHEQLLKGPRERLMEDLLIAMGESLLGDYVARKSVREMSEPDGVLGKVLELELRPARDRTCYLCDEDLRAYLGLAQLRSCSGRPDRFRMLINANEAFTPPGLLFGLLYAWYVNNRFGGIVDYEMSLLRWRISELIPKPSMERSRMQERVAFFREVVFRQKVPPLAGTPAG